MPQPLLLESSVAPPLGLSTAPLVVTVIPRATVPRGEPVEFDFAGALAEVENAVAGAADSALVNVRRPTVLGAHYGRVHGLAMEPLTSGIRGRVLLIGVGEIMTGGATVSGEGVVIGTGDPHGKRIKGIILETRDAAGLVPVLWEGIRGITTFWGPSSSLSSGMSSGSSGFPSSPTSGGSGPPGSWGNSAPSGIGISHIGSSEFGR